MRLSNKSTWLIIPFVFSALFLFSSPCFAACPAGSVCIVNPSKFDSIIDLMLHVMRVVLGIVDILALLMFIYGGVLFMVSAGNAEIIKKAKQTLLWAIIGILLITLSYSITKFIFEAAQNVSN